MKLEEISASIFSSRAECLVNPTNSVGVMGAGLAKEFMVRYPLLCDEFNSFSRTESGLIVPKLYRTISRAILMFPTKVHWRNLSKLEHVEQNMALAVKLLNAEKIKSVAFPRLGCGLGGLSWEQVGPVMVKALESYEGDAAEIYV